MKEARTIFMLLAVAVLAGAEAATIITTVPPADATGGVFWLLFTCLFVFLSIGMSFAWHPVRFMRHPRHKPTRWSSLRQCALVAGVLTIGLALRGLGILTPWDLIPLAIAAVLIELFFQADKRPAYHESPRST